jgi:pimeloyl-ACP methyl ester carboxylesterase/nucleoside-diphosphate-sugar epimerase
MNDLAFVTGATGMIGRWVVPELTRRGVPVAAMMRDAAGRAAEYLAWVDGQGGDSSLVTPVDGDLTQEGLGLDAEARTLARSATLFFHLGAAMAMGLDPEVATETNKRGSERVVKLAASAPALRRLVLISGYRVSPSTPQDADARPGAYEQSKIDADRRIRALAEQHEIPLTIVNPSTVIGDSKTGRTTVFWGFGDVVRDVYLGRLPAIPGGPRHWLPLVTVDYVAKFLATVPLQDDASLAEYFLLDDRTPDFARLIQRIATRVGVEAPTRRVSLKLARTVSKLRGQAHRAESLSFLSEDRYDVAPAQEAARRAGIEAPDIEEAVDTSVDYLVASHFGVEPESTGGFTKVGGLTTFVAGDRRRARVVLIHGYPLDGSSWDPVVSRLGDVPTLRPDMAGPSRSWQVPTDLGGWASSLTAELEEPAVLVGHSYGAAYAFQVALRHPERVSALVLVTPYYMQDLVPYHLRAWPLNRYVMKLMGRKDLKDIVGDDWYTDLFYPNVFHRVGARTQLARGITQAQNPQVRTDLDTQMGQLASSVPITIVHGANEPLIAPAPKGVRVITLGKGHNPHIEAPLQVAELITEHLRAGQKSRESRQPAPGQLARQPVTK